MDKKKSLIDDLNLFREIIQKAKEADKIDLKKVNRIRKAIREGKYEIDYEKLSEKLLEDL